MKISISNFADKRMQSLIVTGVDRRFEFLCPSSKIFFCYEMSRSCVGNDSDFNFKASLFQDDSIFLFSRQFHKVATLGNLM